MTPKDTNFVPLNVRYTGLLSAFLSGKKKVGSKKSDLE